MIESFRRYWKALRLGIGMMTGFVMNDLEGYFHTGFLKFGELGTSLLCGYTCRKHA